MRDVGIWTSLKIVQPIDKRMNISLNEGIRFDNNISNTANIFTQFKSSYEIVKGLKLTLGYRWSKKKSWIKEIDLENRYQIDLSYKYKFKDFGIKHRARYQSKYVNLYSTEFGKFPTSVIRNKTSLSYSINKKIKPYISFEFFYPTTDEIRIVDKHRYSAGVDFRIMKNLYGDVFFVYQNEINQRNPIYDLISGAGISYDLPKIKTKKKKDKDEEDDTKKGKEKTPKKKEKKVKKPKTNNSEEPELPEDFGEDYD